MRMMWNVLWYAIKWDQKHFEWQKPRLEPDSFVFFLKAFYC